VNPWQVAQQLKHLLATVQWADGSQSLVFGPQSVFVTAGVPTDKDMPAGFPFAQVTLEQAVPDPDHPDLMQQTFAIVIAAECAGDPLGEFTMIGGPRPDLGSSAGAGLGEVSERVRAAIQALSGMDGLTVIASSSGTGAPQLLGEGMQVAFEELKVTVLCTSQPFYAPPQQLQMQGATATWRGDHCESRFDFFQYRLGHKAGTVAPVAPADCDAFDYTGPHHATTVSTVFGRTYAIFADYDPRGLGSVSASSRGDEVGAFITP
jgi:hypothetical protein